MSKSIERFFISFPTATTEKGDDGNGNLLDVYLDQQAEPLLWSGDFPLPPVDYRVFVKRNNIGWALVKGYFQRNGHLGVMTLPLRPPWWICELWLEEQKNPDRPEWVKQGIGCNFGNDITLVAPTLTRQVHFVFLTLQYCLETLEATCQCGRCDPCTQGRDDIRTAIAALEDLELPAQT